MKQSHLIPSAVLFGLLTIFTIPAVSQALPAAEATAAEPTSARIVHYSPNDIVPIRAKLRYTTLIVLPADEKILDFTTGDKEFWIINGVQNFCFLHPAKAGIASNLNLITDKGHVYSFTLQEISNEPNAEPDLKVVIVPKDQSAITALGASQPLVPASEIAAYRAEVQTARVQAQKDEEQFRSQYPLQLRFDYEFPKNKDPFDVDAIYEDGNFTYIHSTAAEKPALYEVKDGQPNLVDFQLNGNVYIVSGVIDQGYLQIGKKKMKFHRDKRTDSQTANSSQE